MEVVGDKSNTVRALLKILKRRSMEDREGRSEKEQGRAG